MPIRLKTTKSLNMFWNLVGRNWVPVRGELVGVSATFIVEASSRHRPDMVLALARPGLTPEPARWQLSLLYGLEKAYFNFKHPAAGDCLALERSWFADQRAEFGVSRGHAAFALANLAVRRTPDFHRS